MRKRFLLLFLLCFFLHGKHAQTQTQGILGRGFFSNWSVGIGGGPVIFFGDLKVYRFWPVSSNMNEWRAAGTVTLTRQISHVFALRAQALFGELSGTKRKYKDGAPCNQYFEGLLFEYNLNTTINFSNLIFGYAPGRKFFFYGSLGVGVSNWSVKKKDLLTHEVIGGNAPAWNSALVIPAGLGAYYSFADKLNLGIEWTLRGVNSDKVDATTGGFQYDFYSLFELNLTYNFNKRNAVVLEEANMSPTQGPLPAVKKKTPAESPDKKGDGPRLRDYFPAGGVITFPSSDSALQLQNVLRQVDSMNVQRQAVPRDYTYPDIPVVVPGPEPVTLQSVPESDSAAVAPFVSGNSYRVQVYAFRTGENSTLSIKERFGLPFDVYREYSEGWYRYTVGSFGTLADANALAARIRSEYGIGDAFPARYRNGLRVPTHPSQ